MVMADAQQIEATDGSRDCVDGLGGRLQLALAAADDVDHCVRVIVDDQESHRDR